MTEVQDFTPDPPISEASISAAQVGLYLTAKTARRPCEACNGTDWRLHDELRDECATAIALFKLDNRSRVSVKPTVTIICTGCGCIRQFVRSVVARWLEEHRHG
jgi:hypothetical protein